MWLLSDMLACWYVFFLFCQIRPQNNNISKKAQNTILLQPHYTKTPFMSFFPDSSMTRHFPLENSTMKSWSHIWLMLNRFTFRPSTYRTFAMSGSPSREMIPFPLIYDLLPSPKVTLSHFLDSKRDQSPVMCLEQPLSRYHKHVSITLNGDFTVKHTLA